MERLIKLLGQNRYAKTTQKQQKHKKYYYYLGTVSPMSQSARGKNLKGGTNLKGEQNKHNKGNDYGQNEATE